jgi:hypothetical protein
MQQMIEKLEKMIMRLDNVDDIHKLVEALKWIEEIQSVRDYNKSHNV